MSWPAETPQELNMSRLDFLIRFLQKFRQFYSERVF